MLRSASPKRRSWRRVWWRTGGGPPSEMMRQTYRDLQALVEAALPLCQPCWAGRKPYITRGELVDVIRGNADIPAADREKVLAILWGESSTLASGQPSNEPNQSL